MKAIVVTFERLPAHMLGCYGNEWIETPGFDRLASRSSVFDQHFVEIPGPVGPDHPWWTGRYEYFSNPATDTLSHERSPIELLKDAGVDCTLIAEDTAGLPTSLFSSVESTGGQDGLSAPHTDVPIARLFQRGIERLSGQETEEDELLWLHSRGVPSPWLPPRFFTGLYLNELEDIFPESSGDEIVAELIEQLEHDPTLVNLLLSEVEDEVDDEQAAGLSQFELGDSDVGRHISKLVFAGYVSMIDHWLQKLMTTIEAVKQPLLFVVTAGQGHFFDIGSEFDQSSPSSFGDSSDGRSAEIERRSLAGSVLQTPLIIYRRIAEKETRVSLGTRHQQIVQPADTPAALLNWFRCSDAAFTAQATSNLLSSADVDSFDGRPHALHLSQNGLVGVTTREWFLVADEDSLAETCAEELDVDTTSARLFARPDDQWQVNNVARQHPDQVAELLKILRERTSSRT